MKIDWILWFGMMVPLAFSAGPNNLMCASAGATFGLKKVIPFILGLNANIAFYSFLIGAGLGAFFARYPVSLVVLRYAGVVYILFLGYQFFSAARNPGESKQRPMPEFWTGVLMNALNPKFITAVILMYSLFFHAGKDEWNQTIQLTTAMVLLSMSSHFVWTLAGMWLSKTSAHIRTVQHLIFGIMLWLVGFWILFT